LSATHSQQVIADGIHTPVSYEYANETAREAATGFSSEDLYKFAIQTDNNTFWCLLDTAPTWVQVAGGGGGGVTDHGALTGLNDDDHTQYLLADGTRALTGPLDGGGQNFTNVGTINGVSVSGHQARHLRGGADEVDGDRLDIDFVPANYPRLTTPSEVTSVEHLTAHLAGLDSLAGAFLGTVKLESVGTVTGFSTITAALAAAVSGDVVRVGPGTYAESFTIPSGVTVVGSSADAVVITGSGATGTRVSLSDLSVLERVRVVLPTDASPAIVGPSGSPFQQASILRVDLVGAGGSGIGLRCQTGAIQVDTLLHVAGDADTFVECLSGNLVVVVAQVVTGTVTRAFQVSGGIATLATVGTSSFCAVTSALSVNSGEAQVRQAQFLNCTNGIRITGNGAVVDVESVILASVTSDIVVDPGVTSGTLKGFGLRLDGGPNSINNDYLSSADVQLVGLTLDDGEARMAIIGELSVGLPEKGYESVFGEGDSYTDGMVVLTTDSTAGPTSDGGNLTDASVNAQSSSGSTLTFQGTAANHTILVASSRSSGGNPLKHWGWKVLQATASSGGSYAFEIWDGTAWVDVSRMATHSSNFVSYADNVFLRPDSSEHIRFGLDPDTTWSLKTINGLEAYWVRVRIASAVTTLPEFEQFKLSTSRTELNSLGDVTFHGRARFKESLSFSGNVFGETGGVATTSVSVGSGGLPTGWSHPLKNSLLNTSGDAIYFQGPLPRGTDTSMPLSFEVRYQLVGTKPVSVEPSVTLSVLPLEVAGVASADPGGSPTPVARSSGTTDTLTDNAAQTSTTSLTLTGDAQVNLVTFSGFDVSSYYEGDLFLIRLELDDSGTPDQGLLVWGISLVGTRWTLGESS
jgi:hypothetical protein